MFFPPQFVLYVWQLVSGLKGEQDTAINGDTVWYGDWLIVSGMCKGAWLWS
jgi:hypothetical protein